MPARGMDIPIVVIASVGIPTMGSPVTSDQVQNFGCKVVISKAFPGPGFEHPRIPKSRRDDCARNLSWKTIEDTREARMQKTWETTGS